jgi:hypothetical protein
MAKPPLKHLHFQLTLRNHAAGPQWFIFPAAFYDQATAGPKTGGIFAAEVFSDPEHRVKVLTLLGTYRSQPGSAGGLKALLLPPGAAIELRDFTLSFWGDDPAPLSVHVQVADEFEVKIGGIPLQQWVETKLLCAVIADVQSLSMIASKQTADYRELPVEIRRSHEFVVERALANRCPGAGSEQS